MLELLTHLFPDFSLLSTQGFETKELTVYFWILMVSIVGLASFFLVIHYLQFRSRRSAIAGLIKGQTRSELALNRESTLRRALGHKNREAGKLWREFDESLVFSSDKEHLFNTLDAEHFFNNLSLAHGLTSSRLLAATPSFLTAIGVLGTFIGLTLGLNDLEVNSSEIASLKSGVSMMINGAAVAFMTSVWGVGLSLLLNFIEKVVERFALNSIRDLQHEVDYLYPRIPAEQSLVHIADSSRESKEALQELHERIGDRLQETVEGMSETLQEAIAQSLKEVVAPALQSMANNASQQSTDTLERLIEDFMKGVSSAGQQQGDLMNQAATSVTNAVGGMGEKMDELFAKIEAQNTDSQERSKAATQAFEEKLQALSQSADDREQAISEKYGTLMEQHGSIMEALTHVSGAIESSSGNMNQTAQQLEALGSELNRASTSITQRLVDLMASLEKASDINSEFAHELTTHSDSLKALQASMQGTAEQLSRAAELANNGFDQMSSKQEIFLQSLSREFNKLSETLVDQVNNVEQQAEQWLQSYSKEVSAQVGDRMSQWNKETIGFATQMHNTVNAISGLVDDLERKE